MKISMVSGYGYWGGISPEDLHGKTKQVGGGETAMMQVSKELRALGNDVTVFYGDGFGNGQVQFEGVNYLPMDLFVPIVTMTEQDVLVSWDAPHAFRFSDRAKVHVLAFQLNDAYIGPFDHLIDMYMHPSMWHKEMFRRLYPEMSTTKSMVRITNGLDYTRYADQVGEVRRIPKRVIYSSSPDRGLHHLLRVWPAIRELEPQAELHVFYDMDKWLQTESHLHAEGLETVTSERAVLVREYREANLPNVHFHGGVGQWKLAEEQLKSHVMVYPCDPVRPTEGFSMSILEGISAGCSVVTTGADALKELWAGSPGVTMVPLPIDDGVLIDAVVKALDTPLETGVRYNPLYSWKTVAQRWNTELLRCLNKQSNC